MRSFGVVLMFLALVCGSEVRIPLFVQKPGQESRSPLATMVYDGESSVLEVSDVNEALPEDSYCVGAQVAENYYPCFSYIKLKYPLHYDLYLDTKSDSHLLYKLSLKPNPQASGIEGTIRSAQEGPQAPPEKLRRVTKTYEDKKKKAQLGSASASFEEDVEVDDRTFLQKNWKYLLIGLVLYAVSTGGSAQQ
ncbi:LAME_0F02454g1_1 [Lachancea meyersii CBS 8951]|uniref:LAME_0F02454g1_1 n=1 Tax=Lachancea meyersii CBS 8951 TaxID=1266667 RepID=A0A1G4JQR8_9SACH|nr:LAME_0F02454g1_1 [Lachancea meyersii CBS 8951]